MSTARLERADRHAELLAQLQVLDGDLVGSFHRADSFGASGRDGFVRDAPQDVEAIRRVQSIGFVHTHATQCDVGGTQPVLRRVAAA